MLPLEIHKHAAEDLLEILKVDKVSGLRIRAVLEEMRGNAEFQKSLLTHNADFKHSNIKKWLDQQKQDRNIWRISILQPGDRKLKLAYRIIYAYFPVMGVNRKAFFEVLAIFYKGEIDYDDPGHPNTQRIISDYQSIIDEF